MTSPDQTAKFMVSKQLERKCTVATIRALVTENSVGSVIMSVCIPLGMEGAGKNSIESQLNIGDSVQNDQGMSLYKKPALHYHRCSYNLAIIG